MEHAKHHYHLLSAVPSKPCLLNHSFKSTLCWTLASTTWSHIPVPYLLKSWSSLARDLSSWNNLQGSLWRFRLFSLSTAFTSRPVADAVNSGQQKNWANLKIEHTILVLLQITASQFQYDWFEVCNILFGFFLSGMKGHTVRRPMTNYRKLNCLVRNTLL